MKFDGIKFMKNYITEKVEFSCCYLTTFYNLVNESRE